MRSGPTAASADAGASGTGDVPRWRRAIVPASEFGSTTAVTTRWAVEELWPEEAWGMLSGYKGTYKTYFITDFALALASGQPFCGRAVHRAWRVLVVSEELTPSELQQRLDWLAAGRRIDWRELPLFLGASTGIRLDDESWQKDLRQAMESYRPDFMVWDPLARLFGGDENSARDVRVVTGFLDELRRRHGCRAILVHHDRKPARDRKTGTSRASDWTDAVRGSGDLIAWARTVMHIRQSGAEDGPRVLSIKHTNAPPVAPLDFEVEINTTEMTARVVLSGGTLRSKEPVLLHAVAKALQRAGDAGMTVNALRTATRRNNEDVLAALRELFDQKLAGSKGGVTVGTPRAVYGWAGPTPRPADDTHTAAGSAPGTAPAGPSGSGSADKLVVAGSSELHPAPAQEPHLETAPREASGCGEPVSDVNAELCEPDPSTAPQTAPTSGQPHPAAPPLKGRLRGASAVSRKAGGQEHRVPTMRRRKKVGDR